MTYREVFEHYCGKHRIKKFVRYNYWLEQPINWSVYRPGVPPLSNGKKLNINYILPFDKFFNDSVRKYGFHDTLFNMTQYVYYQMYTKSKRFRKAAQRWKYFCTHNVIADPECVKVGDSVFIKHYNKCGIVTSIDVVSCHVNAKLEMQAYGGKKRTSNMSLSILEPIIVNGVETKVELAITERGKIIRK